MKMIVRRTALAVCTLVLALILPTAASAACTGFDDVPESADCYESVIYLAECEIAAGTGNDCFSPEQLITVEQWAVMLCRAYGAETIGDSWQDVGRSSVVEAYRQGWLNETALSAPRSRCVAACWLRVLLPPRMFRSMTARSTREGHRSARLTTSCAWGGSSGCALMMRIPMRS